MNKRTNHLRRLLTPLLLAVGLASAPLLAQSGNQAIEPATSTRGYDFTSVRVLSNGQGSLSQQLAAPSSVFVATKGSKTYAYVTAGGNNALEVVDVSIPAAPKHAGSISHGVGGAKLLDPSAVTVNGDYAYVTSSCCDALEIVNISDPTKPRHAGSISDGQGGAVLNNPVAVKVVTSPSDRRVYAYVVSSFYAEDKLSLTIIDVTNPAVPVFKGKFLYSKDVEYTTFGENSLAVVGNYAYLCNNVDGVLVVDVSDPASPRLIKSVIDASRLMDSMDLIMVDQYAYVMGSYSSRLTILDMSNPASPSIVGSISHAYLRDYATSLAVFSNNGVRYAYAGAFSAGETIRPVIFNVSNPRVPVVINVTNDSVKGLIEDCSSLKIIGNYAYIADRENNALNILQVCTPATSSQSVSYTPRPVGSIRNGTGGPKFFSPTCLDVINNRVYVGSFYDGLGILSVTEPAGLQNMGSLNNNLLIGNTSLAAVGNRLYMSNDNCLTTVDMSNPARPYIIRSLNYSWVTNYPLSTLYVVDGQYAYVMTETEGPGTLSIINLNQNTLQGKLTNSFFSEITGMSLVRKGALTYAYMSSYDRLLIVDVTNPASPIYKKSIMRNQSLESFDSLIVLDNYVYVVSIASGKLAVFSIINDPLNPTLIKTYQSPGTMYQTIRVGDAKQFYVLADNALIMFDASVPGVPAISGRINSAPDGTLKDGILKLEYVSDFTADTNYLYVLNKSNMLAVFKITPRIPASN